MVELLKCGAMLIFFCLMFSMMGYMICSWMKYKAEVLECVFLGFLGYFALFQCVALPLIFLKQSLSLLIILWCVVLVALSVVCVAIFYRQRRLKGKGIQFLQILSVKESLKNPCMICFIFIMIFACYFAAIQNQWGWDTAYYVGTISTTVDTNTMYQFCGETGRELKQIPFRYAISAFYMNSAVFCKVLGISPIMFQRYVMGTVCVLLYFVVLYLIGKELFKGQSKKIFFFGSVVAALNFFFVSEFTTSQFLLFRSYEAKAYCANIIIPGLFWILIRIHKEIEKKENWKILFLVTLASVPVSMSAILIIPLITVIGILAEALVNKKAKLIGYGLLCLIPNGIYLVIYLLNTLGLFVIKV